MLSDKAITIAIENMRMLNRWPVNSEGAIIRLLVEMVPDDVALDKLWRKLVLATNDWPGPADLRGLLCSFIAPADGIEGRCATLPGYTWQEMEGKAIEAEEADDRLYAGLQLPADLKAEFGAKLEQKFLSSRKQCK